MMKLKTFTTSNGTIIEESSGNVFADLGLPDSDELLLKSQLAFQISSLIKSRKLTQTAAAKIAGISQPKISDIQRGRLDGYSVERLLNVINRLGYDVEVRIHSKPPRQKSPKIGHTSVSTV